MTLTSWIIIFTVIFQTKITASQDDGHRKQLREDGDQLFRVNEAVASILEIFHQMKSSWSKLTDYPAVDISPGCRQHLGTMLTDLIDHTTPTTTQSWSWQMIDAFGKPPDGITRGNMYWMGHFEQCLNARLTLRSSEDNLGLGDDVSGEYCLVRLFLNGAGPSQYPEDESLISINPIDYSSIKWGTCFPTTCSMDDKKTILNHFAKPFNTTVFMDKLLCQTSGLNRMDSVAITLTIIMLIPVMIVIIATICDNRYMIQYTTAKNQRCKNKQNADKCRQICQIFSARTTLNSLLELPTISEGCSLSFINWIRVFLALGVIFNHVFIMMMAALPIKNHLDMYEVVKKPFMSLWSYAFFFMNLYFYLCGFFLSHGIFDGKTRLATVSDMLTIYFKRYIRITAPYIYVMAFIAGPFPYISKGPIWPLSWTLASKCRMHWYKQLTYSQNIVGDIDEEKCVPGEWYLATEMQLYLLAVLLVWLLKMKPKQGFLYLVAIIILSTAAMGLYMGINDWSIFVTISTALNTGKIFRVFLGGFERRFWYRASSCSLGILVGCCITRYKNIIRLSSSFFICGLTLFVLTVAMLLVTGNVYQDGIEMPLYLQVIFGTAGNLLFSLTLSWIIIQCYFTPQGWITKMMSSRLIIVLGKLSYCIYLAHGSVLLWIFFRFSEPDTASYFNQWLYFIATSVFSICAGVVLYFAVESPTGRLLNIRIKGSNKLN